MSSFKPMRAGSCPKHVDKFDFIELPCFAGPKLDGIRGVNVAGVLKSKKLKLIPNDHINSIISRDTLSGMDGELIVGDPTSPDCYRKSNSGVMSEHGEPDFAFFVFDDFTNPGDEFEARMDRLQRRVDKLPKFLKPFIVFVQQEYIKTREELEIYYYTCVALGYEGVITRKPGSPYKFGTPTPKQQYLMKLKDRVDSEARIVGINQKMQNNNESSTNELGYKSKSSKKSGKVPLETTGSLDVIGVGGEFDGVRFTIGIGFDDAESKRIWDNRKSLLGTLVKYSYDPTGGYDAPRQAVYLGPREAIDLDVKKVKKVVNRCLHESSAGL